MQQQSHFFKKVEEALEGFDAIKIDLDTAEFAAVHGMLQPIPGQTRDNSMALLELAAKYVSSLVLSHSLKKDS